MALTSVWLRNLAILTKERIPNVPSHPSVLVTLATMTITTSEDFMAPAMNR